MKKVKDGWLSWICCWCNGIALILGVNFTLSAPLMAAELEYSDGIRTCLNESKSEKSVTADMAIQRVKALPQVISFEKLVKQKTDNNNFLDFAVGDVRERLVLDDGKDMGGFWRVYISEVSEFSIHKWEEFLVDKAGTVKFYLDEFVEGGEWKSLTLWSYF